jgi:hypothetical protein
MSGAFAYWSSLVCASGRNAPRSGPDASGEGAAGHPVVTTQEESVHAASGTSRPVHLIGSVPLASSEAVFRDVGARVGPLVARVPDGEVDGRPQVPLLVEHPDLEIVEPDAWTSRHPGALLIPFLGLRPGADPEQLSFPDLGYATAALDSYRVFASLRDQGVLPAHVRFQVGIQTPATMMLLFVREADRPAIGLAYRSAVQAELTRILADVPHDDLAIQWNVVGEIAEIEGLRGPVTGDTSARVAQTLAELADLVPTAVEVGFHFCYGDIDRQHFVQPRDTRVMVTLARRLAATAARRIDWLHLPVPADRDDPAYFAPLADLDVGDGTAVHLGVVHDDGLAGASRRIAAAARVLPDFGVATECGFGRRDPATIDDLLDLHREVAALD